ncbi:hypothetical protein BZA70DRAFT_92382 [Myxozyma melibiosi]|uniref:G-patch domain-containing protein n=1 Tax=Myxozyma melibiosi TaxID=54550 RepID=A0ABR1EYS8_9ASCO
MNSTRYLTSYGWTPGTGFKKDSLAKPILMHHKKDTKGLGNKSLEHESWWERVFDGRLQGLDVYEKKKEEEERFEIRGVVQSPLYKMFVKGSGLAGSIEESVVVTERKEEKVRKVKKEKKERKLKDKNRVSKESESKKKKKEKKEKSKTKDEEWVRMMVKEMKKKA